VAIAARLFEIEYKHTAAADRDFPMPIARGAIDRPGITTNRTSHSSSLKKFFFSSFGLQPHRPKCAG
jgi:hypothetical protein